MGFRFDPEIPAAEALTSRQVREMALLGRSDIRSALADYAAAQAALGLEIAKQYPDIHLSPGYQWNAGSTGEHDWQLGGTIELPLLNRHRGAIAEAAAKREASAARFVAMQAKVLGEIDSAVAGFRASRPNITALDDLVAAQRRQEQMIEAQFRAGAVTQLDVLISQIELDTTELARFEAQVKAQQALGALEDAVQRPLDLPPSIFQSSQNHAR
jgi:outer membrane protein TolC